MGGEYLPQYFFAPVAFFFSRVFVMNSNSNSNSNSSSNSNSNSNSNSITITITITIATTITITITITIHNKHARKKKKGHRCKKIMAAKIGPPYFGVPEPNTAQKGLLPGTIGGILNLL